jgi:MFS family permease
MISTAVPKITTAFKSLDDIGWYTSAYLLTLGISQLLWDALYPICSLKWTFISCLAVFTAGSAICGSATSSIMLIVGRGVTGFGSGGILSGALRIIEYSVPLKRRLTYTGLTVAYGMTCVVAPIIAGALTDSVSWRWCFYLQIPVAVVVILIVVLNFPSPQLDDNGGSLARVKKIDLGGKILLISSVTCLNLALNWGGSKHPWGGVTMVWLFDGFVTLFMIFYCVQVFRPEDATIPLSLIGKRCLIAAFLFSFAMGSAVHVIHSYLPIWFQAVKGASALESGLMILPLDLGIFVGSLIGKLSACCLNFKANLVAGGVAVISIGYCPPFMIISSVLSAVGFGMVSTFHPDTNYPAWIGYEAMAGIGLGLGVQMPLIAVQLALAVNEVPKGTSIVLFAYNIGGALFVSVGQNLFINKLVSGLKNTVPELDPQTVLANGATSLDKWMSTQFLQGVKRVYNDALIRPYRAAAIIAAIAIFGSLVMEWKSTKIKKNSELAQYIPLLSLRPELNFNLDNKLQVKDKNKFVSKV